MGRGKGRQRRGAAAAEGESEKKKKRRQKAEGRTLRAPILIAQTKGGQQPVSENRFHPPERRGIAPRIPSAGQPKGMSEPAGSPPLDPAPLHPRPPTTPISLPPPPVKVQRARLAVPVAAAPAGGNAPNATVRAAEQLPSMIVASTRGQGGARRIGSTARHVHSGELRGPHD